MTETIVRARGLGLTGEHGRVYGPVDLEIAARTCTVLPGRPGTGRTSLLLTLAGRMAPGQGSLEVCGQTRPHRIFGHCAIAGFSGIDSLDPAVTVRSVVGEQLAWTSPWWRPRGRVDGERIAALLSPVFGERTLPAAHTRVGDLGELDLMLLRIALACSTDPEVLLVDDLDQVRVAADRAELVDRLRALTAERTVIASAVTEPPTDPREENRP